MRLFSDILSVAFLSHVLGEKLLIFMKLNLPVFFFSFMISGFFCPVSEIIVFTKYTNFFFLFSSGTLGYDLFNLFFEYGNK